MSKNYKNTPKYKLKLLNSRKKWIFKQMDMCGVYGCTDEFYRELMKDLEETEKEIKEIDYDNN